MLIECVDACFGLARKKNNNQILFDRIVTDFMPGEILPALRSKGKNGLFDKKGVIWKSL